MTPAPASICIIIPYFGQWPFWSDFFFESLSRNPDINWLFYTDCGLPDNPPPNARFIECSFHDYCQKVSSALGINFQPSSPYKLCDIKPAYGFIHADKISEFDFFAFGDMDVVYGQLRHWLTPDVLKKYDLISTHNTRVSGHLCLLRNTDNLRHAFQLVPDWQKVFENPNHCFFDENHFSRLFLLRKNFPTWLRKSIFFFNTRHRRALFREAFSTTHARVPWIDGSKNFPSCWTWNNGLLTNNLTGNKDFPYLHFFMWKMEDWKNQPTEKLLANPALYKEACWTISAEGFQPTNRD